MLPLLPMMQSTTVHDLIFKESILAGVSPLQGGQLVNWLLFSFLLFFLGLLGMIFNRKNFLVTMMSVELMYLGIITSFVLYGNILQDPRASIYGLLFLILAACESAVGLGILIILYRFGDSIAFKDYQFLGG